MSRALRRFGRESSFNGSDETPDPSQMRATRLEHASAGDRPRELYRTGAALSRRLQWAFSPPWEGFGEPLNGQAIRRRTFEHLVGRFCPDALVETGTFLGFTTHYLADQGVPVYTVEHSPGYFHLSRASLRGLGNVRMILGDSAAALRALSRQRPFERPLLYLDAHWTERLPLAEELECIGQTWEEALVMIDDFRVPGQPGYGFDTYGGTALELERFDLDGALAAFPSAPPEQETGGRRGTAYLARGPEAQAALRSAVDQGLLALAGRPSA